MRNTSDSKKRMRLAAIARAEAELEPAGDLCLAGPQIEKYLSLFRETMNRRAGIRQYSDLSIGYSWCVAFVYYCCIKAGFEIKPEPSQFINGSLAAVSTWAAWASSPGNHMLLAPTQTPEIGDIVLFDRILEDTSLDHIGIVVGVGSDVITTAEGNVHNRGGIFTRRLNVHINSFIRLRENIS